MVSDYSLFMNPTMACDLFLQGRHYHKPPGIERYFEEIKLKNNIKRFLCMTRRGWLQTH
jgi:hypothetical protein